MVFNKRWLENKQELGALSSQAALVSRTRRVRLGARQEPFCFLGFRSKFQRRKEVKAQGTTNFGSRSARRSNEQSHFLLDPQVPLRLPRGFRKSL